MLKKFLLVFWLLLVFNLPVQASAEAPLLITEVKPAGEEFIEIANNTNTAVGDGWRIQYRSASGTGWTTKVLLEGYIEPGQIVAFETTGLADGGGHIRLVDTSLQPVDTVSWGKNLSGVTEPGALPSPTDRQSLMRFWSEIENMFVDTDNNAKDFFVSHLPSPGAIDLHTDQDYPPIEISEILPDPDAASEFYDEFIELYNPNLLPVNLTGYSLQVGGEVFVLNGLEIAAQGYIALPKSYDPTDLTKLYTDLNLTSGKGVVSLATPNSKTITRLQYDGGKKGLSYGVVESGWTWTEAPTPGAANRLVITEKSSGGLASNLKPCRSDQYRNPETNRCKLRSSTGSSLKPCASNQYRSPETNRCRLVSVASSSLKPCAADQYRNPETNRCKKVGSASSTLKACAPNQERNPETNRCRLKKNGTPTSSKTNAVQTMSDSTKTLPLVGIIGGGALMYGLYEWRYDIRNFFHKARGYVGFRRGSGRDP